MKLLHTSDRHFGIGFHGVDVTADQEFFIDRICDIIDANGVIGIISHMQVLRENILTKLETVKTEKHSTLHENIG